eukprot:TRINITY_DN927_c6_g1_i1.p1 TRINITY_DN927_c6_g1~~TRINITY_DN927_c6_g1_i1.p1  ORF type:complete len:529 (+),score=104.97 TRINITY_DN927_c6_g1_i1:89-1675(+)
MIVTEMELTHLPWVIRSPIISTKNLLAIPEDQACLLLIQLIALGLGPIFKRLPSPSSKHMFAVFWGLFFCFALFNVSTLHLLISSLVCYFLVDRLPSHKVGWTMTILAMFHLASCHIYRMIVDYKGWRMDVSVTQMIICAKLSMFAWNYEDGQRLKELKAGELLVPNLKAHTRRAEHSLTEKPSLLEFFSYILFYPAVFCGPCFEYTEYIEFVRGQDKVLKKCGLKEYPSSFLPALKTTLLGFLFFVGIHLTKYVPMYGYMDTKAFMEETSILYKFAYITVACSLYRMKYYLVWYVAEGGCIAANFGFNGVEMVNGKPVYKWNRVNNAEALPTEFGRTITDVTDHWNKNINNWLKYYVYTRLCPSLMSATAANAITKLTSAFWHGFYSGYFAFFMSGVFLNIYDSILEKRLLHFFQKKVKTIMKAKDEKNNSKEEEKEMETYVDNYPVKYVYDVFCFLANVVLVTNYASIAFMMLEVTVVIPIWKSMYFAGHWIPPAVIILDIVVSKVLCRKKHGKVDADKEKKSKSV